MSPSFHSVLAALALFSPTARAALPALRDPEPPPLTRAPEHLRRSVELVPKFFVMVPLCATTNSATPCELGPIAGAELAALYRPNVYFAFGGSVWYGRAIGAGAPGATGNAFGGALVGRVYLLETGALDPYLEALAGFGSERIRRRVGRGLLEVDAATGSYGRAGGGVDWFVASTVKLGAFAGYSELLPSDRGVVTAGFAMSVLWGESL